MSAPEALDFGKYYHIYNRGNNRENLFREEQNYRLFLALWAKYIVPVAVSYAYVLLKNHFHFLVRTRTVAEQAAWWASRGRDLTGEKAHLSGRSPTIGGQIEEQQLQSVDVDVDFKPLDPSKQFSNLFNAYARTFNNTYRRTGALFQRPFGRIEVTSDRYFRRLVLYIHQNPQKHGFVQDFREWPYSSYHTLLSLKQTLLQRDAVLSWFDNKDGFHFSHNRALADHDILAFFPDDFD